MRTLLSVLVLGVVTMPIAAQPTGEDLVTCRLVAKETGIAPGGFVTIGVVMTIAPGWHVYWRSAGASGVPTSVTWRLPEGAKAGTLRWPAPTILREEGVGFVYVYERQVMLMADVELPTKSPDGGVKIGADVAWLVCKESCVTGSAKVELVLPQTETRELSSDAALFARFESSVPTTPSEAQLTVTQTWAQDGSRKGRWTLQVSPLKGVDPSKVKVVPEDEVSLSYGVSTVSRISPPPPVDSSQDQREHVIEIEIPLMSLSEDIDLAASRPVVVLLFEGMAPDRRAIRVTYMQ